nr:hypothetical protein SHINE37_41695 [Rhizobiaceae bacterium]
MSFLEQQLSVLTIGHYHCFFAVTFEKSLTVFPPCSARFPYFLNPDGHPRPPAIHL